MAHRQQRPSSGLFCCGMESKSAYSDILKKNEQGDFMLDMYLFRKMPERHWHIFRSFLNAWHSVSGGYLWISPNKIEKNICVSDSKTEENVQKIGDIKQIK